MGKLVDNLNFVINLMQQPALSPSHVQLLTARIMSLKNDVAALDKLDLGEIRSTKGKLVKQIEVNGNMAAEIQALQDQLTQARRDIKYIKKRYSALCKKHNEIPTEQMEAIEKESDG